MRYVRHLDDADGNLVETLYYCCRPCYVEEPEAELAKLRGGWWPCLDSELETVELCRVCDELIGPADLVAAFESATDSRSRPLPRADADPSPLRQRLPLPARDRRSP